MGAMCLSLRWMLVVASVRALQTQTKIRTDCLGNLFGIVVAPVTARGLEVAAGYNDSLVPLTKSLTSPCGFSSNMDSSGTLRIFASLLNCFSHNQKDQQFSLDLRLRLFPDEIHTVTETCQYQRWASREVLCQRNYMEVSVERVLPEDQLLLKSFYGAKSADPRRDAQQKHSSFPSTTLRFFSQTGEPQDMDLTTALSRGYSLSLTHSRLVLRSPLSTTETYVQQVSRVPMTVLRTSTVFGRKWLSSQIHAAAACPLLEGSVSFSGASIRWLLPKRIDPLLSAGQLTLLDVGLGVNGRRLQGAELAAHGFSLTLDDSYITVDIAIGAKGGHYKSAVQNGRYLMFYRVEPMLELLWTEDTSNEDTRYKVLLPITTPHINKVPQVTQNADVTGHMFQLGPFAPDVVLLNISSPTERLSLRRAVSRGVRVQEQLDRDSGLKSFWVHIPRSDPTLQHTMESSQLRFEFLVLPELQSFSISTALDAEHTGPERPLVSGACDDQHFHVQLRVGSRPFLALVGGSTLTSSLARQYGLVDHGAHMTLSVPILAQDVIYEAIEPSGLKARLEVTLVNPEDHKRITDFSLSCSFFSTLTECFPNGTITVLALKVEAVPGLDLAQLTLTDPLCGPTFSTNRYAYFSFTGNSCGTTRKFVGRTMVYENDIALPDEQLTQRLAQNKEPEYHLRVRCSYDTNTTRMVSSHVQPSRNEPVAETSTGQLHVHMRMAHDHSFGSFYTDEDFPLSVSQQEALWFEVELLPDLRGRVSVELETCWATEDQDKASIPRWSFIHNGCVVQDSPLKVLLIPVRPRTTQTKRFTLHLDHFIQKQASLQLFVHCDVVVCDPVTPTGGVCSRSCSDRPPGPRLTPEEHVSTGPIFLTT